MANDSAISLSPPEYLAFQARRLLEQTAGAAKFLEGWPGLRVSRSVPARQLPVVRELKTLTTLGTAATSSFVNAIGDAADRLEWRQTYAAADFGPAFLDCYGWTELVGSRGPIASSVIACGLLMLGPRTDYPAHAHEAEELYLPLAGTALWMRGEEGYVSRAPGHPIFHSSWMAHAMRTESEPLLALYVWRGGDLAAKSIILPSAG